MKDNIWASSSSRGAQGVSGPVTRELRAATDHEAVAAAAGIGYPVALKVDSPHILHKTEAGAIRLDLSNAAQVRAAFGELMANARQFLQSSLA